MRYNLMLETEYRQASTSTADKWSVQSSVLVAEQNGLYFPNFSILWFYIILTWTSKF